MEKTKCNPIGIIHSPFGSREEVPRQSILEDNDTEGYIEIFPEYTEGLRGIEKLSKIVIVFNFHLSGEASLKATPPMASKSRGVFVTRSPDRPNSIGVSVVRLVKRENNRVYFKGVDMVDGTPVLDIKPYIAE